MTGYTLYGDRPDDLFTHRGLKVAVDTETTGLEFSDSMVGFSVAWHWPFDRRQTRSFYYSSDAVHGQMSLPIEGESAPVGPEKIINRIFKFHRSVFHNIAFDYRVLMKEFSVDCPERPADTMHKATLVQYNPSLDLDSLIRTILMEEPPDWYTKFKTRRNNIKNVPPHEVARYARADSAYTLRIDDRIDELIESHPMSAIKEWLEYDTRFTKIVMQMIKKGIPIDYGWLQDRRRRFVDRCNQIKLELSKKGLMMISSNNDVAKFLFRIKGLQPIIMTEKGNNPSVSEDALYPYREDPDVMLITEHRQLEKAIGTWIDPYLANGSFDGRIHSLINPFGTISHRISAGKPNVAAIPMEDRGDAFGSMMGMFKASEGKRLYSVDIKQAEVRLAAIFARCNGLAVYLASGKDPYNQMSNRMWGTESRRNDAKRAVLSAIYEIGPAAYARKYKVKEEDARVILTQFRNAFPQMKQASKLDSIFVEQKGYIPAWTGKPRYFGPPDVDPYYAAFNQRVQSGVAELLQRVMLDVESRHPGKMLLQIYDSIIMELEDIESNAILKDVQNSIANILPDKIQARVNPKIPFLTDVKLWEAKKESPPTSATVRRMVQSTREKNKKTSTPRGKENRNGSNTNSGVRGAVRQRGKGASSSVPGQSTRILPGRKGRRA